MFGRIRNSTFTRFLFGLLGLYFLNISVDSPDPFPNKVPEDLSFNDQESIVELIVEQVLGFEDLIREVDDPDPEDHNSAMGFKMPIMVQYTDDSGLSPILVESRKGKFPEKNVRFPMGFDPIDTPPPRI